MNRNHKKNHLIIRDRNVHNGYISRSRSIPNIIRGTNNHSVSVAIGGESARYRRNFVGNLRHHKHERKPTGNSKVVILNGDWGTEMHNVNLEELNVFQRDDWEDQQFSPPNNITSNSQPFENDMDEDGCDGNLSWLLNYKIHELPPVPDTTGTDQYPQSNQSDINIETILHPSGKSNQIYIAETLPKRYSEQLTLPNLTRVDANNLKQYGASYKDNGLKKPPFTYTELIEHALNEKGKLTVSGIYQWITDHFPYYKQNDDRWKNSVRHNLSINPHFRKGSKAVHGAGHLWTIAQHEDKKSWNIKQRMEQFIQNSNNQKQLENQIELEAATASILPENCEENPENRISEIFTDGNKQNIKIEYVNVIDVTNGLEDFLCPPVPKEQMVEECGLGGNYLITDLNPNCLGLNLADVEIINSENLYDDLNFQCYDLQSDG